MNQFYVANLGSISGQILVTVKLVHLSEIYHKSSPPRRWDGCTFVGANLRVCGLWVRSRPLAANHAGGPGPTLHAWFPSVPTSGVRSPVIHQFPTLGFDPVAGDSIYDKSLTCQRFINPSLPRRPIPRLYRPGGLGPNCFQTLGCSPGLLQGLIL